MKTMTCKQMGGPCDTPIRASSAEEMMERGKEHVGEMAAKGDDGHIRAKVMMDKGPNDPENRVWMQKFMADFAALPED
jgi:hypothetical protein